jgi:hypothetical protein
LFLIFFERRKVGGKKKEKKKEGIVEGKGERKERKEQ